MTRDASMIDYLEIISYLSSLLRIFLLNFRDMNSRISNENVYLLDISVFINFVLINLFFAMLFS